MATRIELRGLHTVRSKGRIYYYAWRGGPRLDGQPGTPEFIASYNAAILDRSSPDTTRFRSLVSHYKASEDYQKLADSTKRQWSRWLDRIAGHFGELSIAQFGRPERIRPIIIKWRSNYVGTPRTADYAMQVLSRVLSYAVDRLGVLPSNPCDGIRHIYNGSRAEIIWSETDIGQLKQTCSPEVANAVDLAAHTGLRLGDLLRLSWSHIGEDAIIITTGKSGHSREAIVPIYDKLQEVLDRIPRRSPIVLTNSWGRPWSGFNASFGKAKQKAWPDGKNLHFHDLRGTAATKFYVAGLSEREIAEIMGWEEQNVSRIIRRYVGRQAAIKRRISKLNGAGR